MHTVKTYAQLISNNLHSIEIKNGDDSRIVWTDEAPDDLKTWFRDVSGDYTQNNLNELDDAYYVLDTLCDIITDEYRDDDADITEWIYEYEWASVYNYDLLQWVKDSLYRIADVDEALQNGAGDLVGALSMAMHSSRANMACAFHEAIEQKVKELNGGE